MTIYSSIAASLLHKCLKLDTKTKARNKLKCPKHSTINKIISDIQLFNHKLIMTCIKTQMGNTMLNFAIYGRKLILFAPIF